MAQINNQGWEGDQGKSSSVPPAQKKSVAIKGKVAAGTSLKKSKHAVWGCLGMFLFLLLLGISLLVLMLAQDPTTNPVLDALGIEPALLKQVLSLIVNIVFGFLALVSLIFMLIGLFRWFNTQKSDVLKKRSSAVMFFISLVFFGFSAFLWVVLNFYISQMQVGSSNSGIILTEPENTIGLVAPVSILFSAEGLSKIYVRERVISYTWDLDGDGEFNDGNGQTIRYTYDDKINSDGNIVTGLKMVLGNGREVTYDRLVNISNILPRVSVAYLPEELISPVEVTFSAAKSVDPDGNIVSYSWDFDADGVEDENGEVVRFLFNTGGEKTVVLTVVDNNGGEVKKELPLRFKERRRPEAIIEFSPSDVGQVPFEVSFDGGTSFMEGSITEYKWDFGDGSSTETGRRLKHLYDKAGDYDVVLTIRSTDKQELSVIQSIKALKEQIFPVPKILLASGDVSDVFLGSSVQVESPAVLRFSADESYDSDGSIVEYRWRLNDVDEQFGDEVEYNFVEPGDYTVKLFVVDDDGLEVSAELIVEVDRPNLKVDLQADNSVGSVPLEVTFDASGSSVVNGSIVSFEWEFGDSTAPLLSSAKQVHVYDKVGEYTVKVTAILADGQRASEEMLIVVRSVELQALYDFNPKIVHVGEKVFFDGGDSLGDIKSYYWEFGDGDISRVVKPEHVYNVPGIYEVLLEVKGYQNDVNRKKLKLKVNE